MGERERKVAVPQQLRVARLREALLLVMVADNHERSKRGNPHLGRARWSGMEQGCVQCIAAMALGESGDTPTAEAFAEARVALAPPESAREGCAPQVACDRCSVGVMDAGNPHVFGACSCACHKEPDHA